MVQAIKTRKYVDLADLLPEALREMQFDEAKETKAKDEARKKKFTISSTLDWSVAFSTYMAVTSHFDPSRAFALSAYQSIVLNLARDVGGQAWLRYDKVFRQAAAVNPGLDWHRREQDIWFTSATTPFGSTQRGPSQSGSPPSQRARVNPDEICIKWNQGRCNFPACKFRHVCFLCQGAHITHRCYRYQPTEGAQQSGALGSSSRAK